MWLCGRILILHAQGPKLYSQHHKKKNKYKNKIKQTRKLKKPKKKCLWEEDGSVPYCCGTSPSILLIREESPAKMLIGLIKNKHKTGGQTMQLRESETVACWIKRFSFFWRSDWCKTIHLGFFFLNRWHRMTLFIYSEKLLLNTKLDDPEVSMQGQSGRVTSLGFSCGLCKTWRWRNGYTLE